MIDRFVVNISCNGQVRGCYSGIFGLATVNMTTEIMCKPNFIETTVTNLPTMGTISATSTMGTISATSTARDLVLISVPPTILIIVLIAVIAFLSIVTIILYWKIRRSKKANTTEVVRGRDGQFYEIQTVFHNSSTINSTTPYYSVVNTVSLKGMALGNVESSANYL